jgi:hypothetical protein
VSNPLAFLANPRQHPTNMAYTNGFAYGAALNMLSLLMPLYALDLGFRLSDQGIIVAAPAVFMIIMRLPGGPSPTGSARSSSCGSPSSPW